jgi:hypothetical protein
MGNGDTKFKIFSIALIIAIIAVIVFVIVPKHRPVTPEDVIQQIDLSNSAWIEQYMGSSVDLFGNDFYVGTAFSYNIRSNKMVVTYASQNSVEELRQHYLTLPGAELSGRNDETSLNITALIDGQELQVYNFYSEISRVLELSLTLGEEASTQVVAQLEEAFPEQGVAQIMGVEELVGGDVFGGYVRYDYDQFDGFVHPNIPIFSRAYYFDGVQEDFDNIIAELNTEYPENRYDESQKATYYRIDGQIISISYLVTDQDESIVTISIQQEPN